MIVIGCSNSRDLAKKIARQKKCRYSDLSTKQFPDGEEYIKFKVPLAGEDVVIVQSMQPYPNDALVETLFAVRTAKELGAKKITLVCPYLSYMRQDKRFNPGEAVSNVIIAHLLSFVDQFLTVDMHLHRISSPKKIFKTRAKNLEAGKTIGEFIKKHVKHPIIVGPDWESRHVAEEVARACRTHVLYLEKQRSTKTGKVTSQIKGNKRIEGKNVVIADDIISSGATIIEAMRNLEPLKPKAVYVVCTHGLFRDGALSKIRHSGVKWVASTNTVKNHVEKIDVSKLIAKNLS